MKEFTPGPWRCYIDANGDQWIVDSNANADHLLVVSCGPPGTSHNPYSEGNARLISAGPDLLAACKAYLEAIVRYGHPDKTDRLMRAAIDKAEGRSE